MFLPLYIYTVSLKEDSSWEMLSADSRTVCLEGSMITGLVEEGRVVHGDEK